jgi:putative nucleotidyltransferase with HDIG domain
LHTRAATHSLQGRALERSLTLLRVFLVASAAILLVGGLVLGTELSSALRAQALDDTKASLLTYVDGVVGPSVVRNGRIRIAPRESARLLSQLHRQPDLVTIKVWRADGVLAWTSRDRTRIGRHFELEGDLGQTLQSGHAHGSIDHLSSDEDAVERGLGFDHLLEVYAPISARPGGKPIGAYEIYADPRTLESLISSRLHVLWAALAIVFLALYVALAFLVRGASRFLRRQTERLRRRSRELLDSYNRLEQSSLEAIETLNATVEAKDPYTAGHSQRVQTIALAIGEELGLSPQRLDVLRYAALFHDIGKLAVPDAILTKPSALAPEEFEAIKRHPVDGAAIVGKLGRLRPTVPLIRHHHERWDGGGYPDRLGGHAVPQEAYVVGLADAWDAMTTDRPYQRALGWEEAADEVRRGRGSQFSPDVVDAFFRALRRRSLPGTAAAADLDRAAG